MLATVTRSDNRIARHFDTMPSRSITVPTDPMDRAAVWPDAVIAAVLTLKSLLASDDPAVALKAAEMILNLEKASIRHDRPITGMSLPTVDQQPVTPQSVESPSTEVADLDELQAMGEEERFEYYIEFARRDMQAGEDAKRSGVVVTRAMAEKAVRTVLAEAQNPMANAPPNRGDPRSEVRSTASEFSGSPPAKSVV